jgi:hypothetical protein
MDVEVVLNNERGGDSVTYRVQASKELERERRGTQGQRLPPPPSSEDGSSSGQKVNGFTIKM